MTNEYMTTKQVANELEVSVATVCRWVRDGIIPAKRFGKRIIKIPCVEVGNLVFEIICMFPVTQADAKAACKGFHSGVTIPPVGSHVSITGTWVQDMEHAKWFEIHPVTSIVVGK